MTRIVAPAAVHRLWENGHEGLQFGFFTISGTPTTFHSPFPLSPLLIPSLFPPNPYSPSSYPPSSSSCLPPPSSYTPSSSSSLPPPLFPPSWTVTVQSLVFLIRDWYHQREHPHGLEGGEGYLKLLLKVIPCKPRKLLFTRLVSVTDFLKPARGFENGPRAHQKVFRFSVVLPYAISRVKSSEWRHRWENFW